MQPIFLVLFISLTVSLCQVGAVFFDQGTECEHLIESTDGHKNGTIRSSDSARNPYPSGVTCTYMFVPDVTERVQLNFTHMDLHVLGTFDPSQCENQDRLSVFVELKKAEWYKLGSYCGRQAPGPIMSSGRRMKVVLHSDTSPKDNASGFTLAYRFRTDFAITGTGVQDQRKGHCLYEYNSTWGATGYFTSPNYPGNYPNNCTCKYVFHGGSKEQVNVSFDVFELWDDKCDLRTESDKVSFSNFENTDDTIFTVFCGNQPRTEVVTSDGAFFEVTFKSNDKYDSTGFVGKYTFFKSEEYISTTAIGQTAQASRLPSISTAFIITIFLLCKTVITISS